MPSPTLRLSAAILALATATTASAQDVPVTGVSNYTPDFFARVQPTTAYDMVLLLPGFRLTEGDAKVRGYSGSGGNVLVDGQRPASKQETLETILKRIPAARVHHIELIRGGASGTDMQGYALVANVVRDRSARLSGRVELEDALFRHYTAPRAAAEMSFTSGERTLDLAGAIYREIDDEHGFGRRDRFAQNGSPVRLVTYAQPEGDDIIDATIGYRQPLLGGTIRLNGLFKDKRTFADIDYAISFPAPEHIVASEGKHTRIYEGGMRYERSLGSRSEIELLGSYRSTSVDGVDREFRSNGNDRANETSLGTETIARGLFRHHAGPVTLEAGAEGAINVLDSANLLFENDVFVALPNANVRVEEKRAEMFGNVSWAVNPSLTLESGLRYEVSHISQSGDSTLAKSLAFLKPRARLTWAASERDQIRLLFEREVGQLKFDNFVGAASITSGTVTAGNQDLEPDSLWRAEVTYERRIGKGSIVLAARREWISDVVDRLPILVGGTVFDSVGNIGNGRRDELEGNLNLPLEMVGLNGFTVQANGIWLRSEVTDPTTGQRRRISDDVPIQGKVTVTHDIPKWHLRWGGSYVLAAETASFKVTEVETDVIRERVDLFVEYKPTSRWTFRVFGKNLADSPAVRTRDIFTGPRGASALRYREVRTLRSGPYMGLTIQRNFGG